MRHLNSSIIMRACSAKRWRGKRFNPREVVGEGTKILMVR
jgi:hypothetical protein